MADATPQELLLPVLLAMDVYHRNVEGGLFELVDSKTTSIDGVTPFGDPSSDTTTGFFAKAYTDGSTIYISYRGTDDGSLLPTNIAANGVSANGPLKDLFYGYPIAVGAYMAINGSTSQAVQAVLDRALALQAKQGNARAFNLRNYEVDLAAIEPANDDAPLADCLAA